MIENKISQVKIRSVFMKLTTFQFTKKPYSLKKYIIIKKLDHYNGKSFKAFVARKSPKLFFQLLIFKMFFS